MRRKKAAIPWLAAVLASFLTAYAALAATASASLLDVKSVAMAKTADGVSFVSVDLTSNDSDLNAFDIQLAYRSEVASLTSFELGVGWSEVPVAGSGIDNVGGHIRVVAIRTAGTPQCPPGCILLALHWHGEIDGSFVLSSPAGAAPTLAHSGSALKDVTLQYGTVTVGISGSSPSPSASHTVTTSGTASSSVTPFSPSATATPQATEVPGGSSPPPSSPSLARRAVASMLAHD